MGRDLTKWAAQQNFLPKGDYQVLLAMGMVAHDSHGQFFGNPTWFIEEYHAVHGINNHSTLKNHYASLVRRGCIGRIRKGNGRNPKKKGSATLYQLLAYGFLPATAFEEYEEAVRKRGDPSPPRAQGSLPILTLEQDLLESQEVLPRQDLLESQEVLPRQDLLEPGSPIQTGPPKQHDVHVANDHASSTAKSEEEDVDRMIRQFILAAQKLAGIHNLFPKHLSEVRAYLLESGYDLEPQDCVYVLETVLSWLPEEAWAVESRIVGALNHNIKQYIAKACDEGVYVDPLVARTIRARMQERNAL